MTQIAICRAPKKPDDGDLWFDTNTSELFMWRACDRLWIRVHAPVIPAIQTVMTKEQFEQWAVDAVTQ